MQGDTAHDLDIKGNHVPLHHLTADFKLFAAHSAAGILDYGECFAHQIIQRFSVGKAVFEFRGFCLQLFVGQLLELDFYFIDTADQRKHFFDIPLGFGAEYCLENGAEHSTPPSQNLSF